MEARIATAAAECRSSISSKCNIQNQTGVNRIGYSPHVASGWVQSWHGYKVNHNKGVAWQLEERRLKD
jgi:hypothetical protein